MITIDYLKANKLILLECISGSRAYGLDTPSSDTDIKGVFYLPKSHYFALHTDYVPQVNNATNDIVYYELGRFIDLLLQNNPNMMELLATPTDKVLYKHPLMNAFNPDWFVSKLCQKTFAGFAISQIKKAKGLNKKIMTPMDKTKKSILEFCVVYDNHHSIDLLTWLETNHLHQQQIGLSAMPHAKEMYALFLDSGDDGYQGIIQQENATKLLLSHIPKGKTPTTYLSFNQMGYEKYCKDYADYWHWVANRNEERYQSTLNHGKHYDAKNMMHTFRLLQTALDIANTGKVIIKRDNRDELLAIKSGKYEYDELIKQANELLQKTHLAFLNSHLPKLPDRTRILQALMRVRDELY